MKKLWKDGTWLFILFGLCIAACVVLSIGPTVFHDNPTYKALVRSIRGIDLTQHTQQWNNQVPKHYRYALRQGSMAVGIDDDYVLERVIIEIQDGAIVSLHDGRADRTRRTVTESALVYKGGIHVGGSVEKLFSLIQDAIDHDADGIDVSYNTQFGYPEHIGITYNEHAFDDWIGFSVEDFEVLP